MKFVVCVKQMRDEICCVRERIRDEFLAVVFGCVKKGVKESLKKRVKKIGRKHSKYRCNQTIHFSFCFHAFLSRTPFYPPCLPTIRVPFLPRPLAKKKTTLFIFGDTRIRKKIKNIPGTASLHKRICVFLYAFLRSRLTDFAKFSKAISLVKFQRQMSHNFPKKR